MDNLNNQKDNFFEISIDTAARESLRIAATWARIIAVLGLINAAITLIQTFAGGAGGNTYAFVGGALIVMIFVAIAVVINIFLLRFATNILTSLSNMNQVQFNEGINSLRMYFKIVGIIIIIVVSLFILFILLFGLGMSMR